MCMIDIRKIGITDLDTDAVVNAANEGLLAGGGVCGAIFQAAGYEPLQAACSAIGGCETGSAVCTPGFSLKAKYIIHAVGPRWTGGRQHEPELLYKAYQSALKLAVLNNCRSIGFPLISAGIFGYPQDQAWETALKSCRDFLEKGYRIDIVFAVIDEHTLGTGIKKAKAIAPEYAVAFRYGLQVSEMPERHETFILDRTFTSGQMKALRKGIIPADMDDRWFCCMEGDTFYAYRSWTGTCIYQIDFSRDGKHKVTVNRDPGQYNCSSLTRDVFILTDLLSSWSRASHSEKRWALKEMGFPTQRLLISGQETDAVFFHRPGEPYGFLSNWYPAPFDLDGIHYTSAEQYIMHQKCLLFKDTASAGAVLAGDDVEAQQEIGRKAKNYVDSVWAGKRQLIALRGLKAKFSQNAELKQKLLDTGDAWLVECACSDTIWACGIRLSDPERFDVCRWRGQNLLGFALMEVRSFLQEKHED